MSDLDRKAILIKVSIHHPRFTKKDKRASRDVAVYNKSDESMSRVVKHLISREAFKKVDKGLNKIMPFIYSKTLPWQDGGWRLLPVSLYEETEKGLRDLIEDANEHIDVFLNNYELHCKEASVSLGKLYNPAEYPKKEELRDKFKVDVFFAPLPNSQDLRIQIDGNAMNEIKNNVENHSNKALKEAMNDVRSRIEKVLQRLSDRLKADITTDERGKEIKPRLFNSMISSVQDLIQILPDLNLDNDTHIEDIRREMEDEFMNLDIDSLKEDQDLRDKTAEKADEILDNLKGIV